MNYEQKYNEALERAKEFYNDKDNIRYANAEGMLEDIFPELKESEDEKVREYLIRYIDNTMKSSELKSKLLSWLEKQDTKKHEEELEKAYKTADKVQYRRGYEAAMKEMEKQGEQKPTQEIEPFEAEHGKYYYCIKDYFCGGRKQASKGDVVQALRGLPIMGLKDASEYFLPVSFIKCNSAWSEKDENVLEDIEEAIINYWGRETQDILLCWLKTLKQRIGGEQ